MTAKDSNVMYFENGRLSKEDLRTALINQATAQIIDAYLEYTASVIETAMKQKGYGSDRFKEIGDALVITPEELIALVDKIQVALSEVD